MKEKFKCVVCEKEFKDERRLHGHLKAHDLIMAEYYQENFPRHDFYDGKIIKFKNKGYYFNTDFNSRTNLRLWLNKCDKDDAKEYCTKILTKRKEEKKLTYAPSQVELRSIMSPPIQYYHEVFGNYYELCEELNLENKYIKFNDIVSGTEYDKPEYFINVDTREKKPLKFKRPVEIKKLDYGDYSFSCNLATCNCYIERKSLVDFINTISGGFERFNSEIMIAEEEEANLIILVESKFYNALHFNQLRKKNSGDRVHPKIKTPPEFIFHRVRELIQKYTHIQFLFVDGRKEAARVVERIFTCGCAYKSIDLQLAYDLNIL
jgi:hypothetical protein